MKVGTQKIYYEESKKRYMNTVSNKMNEKGNWLILLYGIPLLAVLVFPYVGVVLISYFHKVYNSSTNTDSEAHSTSAYFSIENIFIAITTIFLVAFIYRIIRNRSFSWKSWVMSMILPTALYAGVTFSVFSPLWMNVGLYLSILHKDAVREARILDFGVNPNNVFDLFGKNENRYTPLMVAVLSENADSVRRLLNVGADPNIQNAKGKTALDIARENKFIAIVAILEGTKKNNYCFVRDLQDLKKFKTK